MNPRERKEALTTAREVRRRGEALIRIGTRLTREADALDELLGGDNVRALGGRQLTNRLGGMVDVGNEVHYRELLEVLRVHGYVPGGVDPKGTLLAALHRSPHFEKVGSRTGRYRRV